MHSPRLSLARNYLFLYLASLSGYTSRNSTRPTFHEDMLSRWQPLACRLAGTIKRMTADTKLEYKRRLDFTSTSLC